MTDLFSDPILFIPVIAILAIFGAFYITAMIWSYNRDAKKQGKKSGCLPMVFFAALICFSPLFSTGCDETQSPPVPAQTDSIMSEEEVLSAATSAIQNTFPDSFDSYLPYRAELQDGIWHVFGTLPINTVGGTPEAEIRDADGEIISIYHTQ